MSEVTMIPQYRVSLTHDEFRIVGLALAGKITGRADTTAAADLNVKLARQRADMIAQLATVANGAAEKAEEAAKELRE